MKDAQIVQMYWDRNEDAIQATEERYGSYCHAVAMHILDNQEDAAECVNDTYLRAWNNIPPHRPADLKTFLGKITRNLAFSRYRYKNAGKRGGGQIPAVLSELQDCLADPWSTEDEVMKAELTRALNDFLAYLPKRKRHLMIRRYWYAESIRDIAAASGKSEAAISTELSRLRGKLKEFLRERGIE
ncbi:MAG: sigma-70 family RNA polymerase sigma factor [Firmicutes bacterium]|nr:sigma-70 family RNA polymerase sigma factor [Bacillota bacterium]